jgi:hypothetical protein
VPETPKSRLELLVELVKATAWPLFAAAVLIIFWGPLHETAKVIPALVGRSDTLTIAGLSLKVSHGLRQKASPEVQKAIGELSREGIERALSLSSSSWWDKGSEVSGRSDYADLLRLGLVEEVPASEVEAQNKRDQRNFGYAVRITELGKRVQSFLRSLVAELVQELPKEAPNEESQ